MKLNLLGTLGYGLCHHLPVFCQSVITALFFPPFYRRTRTCSASKGLVRWPSSFQAWVLTTRGSTANQEMWVQLHLGYPATSTVIRISLLSSHNLEVYTDTPLCCHGGHGILTDGSQYLMSFRFILGNTAGLAPFPLWRYTGTRISKGAVRASSDRAGWPG